MCGICGFYKIRSNATLNKEYINKMNQQMVLRGPDGGDIWLEQENQCGLGHRRLSILDLSDTAKQPMLNEDESIALAFNGEIYNHRELRKELEEIGGHIWKTNHSDTEVIIHSYEQWGIDCLQKFRGMFAFALWDGRKKECILVRDRMGIKPLYYMYENGVLNFASEIKALLQVKSLKPQINKKAMYDYLSFLSTPCEDTLFEGIKKIPPSTYMIFSRKNHPVSVRYWDVLDHTHPELYSADDETISEAIMSELRTSVKLRKESDVPVGIFLSGGIDSSTNAALFSENETNNVKTFCIGYNQDYANYKNETQYAKKMAEYCGAEYYEKLLSEDDLFEFLPTMAKLQDEPIADPTCFPAYFVSKMAREQGVIVAQVGEGSDELFWGYRRWKAYLKLSEMNEIRCPASLKNMGLSILNACGKGNRDYSELLRRSIVGTPIFWSGAEGFHEYDKNLLLTETFKHELMDYTSFEAIRPTYERFLEKSWDKSYVNWMGYADINHRLPELLLMRVDKMSMGASLECRVPFLDHKLAELAMSISQKKKTEQGINKIVLKKAVRGVIPDELIDRKKQGFTAPVYDWFLGRLGEKMKTDINEFALGSGLINTEYVDKIFMSQVNAKKIWYLFNLSLWWKEYIA